MTVKSDEFKVTSKQPQHGLGSLRLFAVARHLSLVTVVVFAVTCHLPLVTVVDASDVGKAGAQFLKIGTGARPMGMAGAFGAVAGDVHGMNWNPGGMGYLEKRELSTTYLRYFQDVDFGYLGYGHPTKHGAFGLGVTYLTLGDIEGRTSDTPTADREFGASDMSVALSYARRGIFPSLGEEMALGVVAKVISQKIDDEKAMTGAADLGVYYKTPWEGLDVGLAIQNMGPGVEFIDERDPLPLTIKLGMGYKIKGTWMVTADVDQNVVEKKTQAAMGTEYGFRNIDMRAGYRFGEDTKNLGAVAGMAAGMGFRIFQSRFDYAFVPFGDLGDTHRFSLSLKF